MWYGSPCLIYVENVYVDNFIYPVMYGELSYVIFQRGALPVLNLPAHHPCYVLFHEFNCLVTLILLFLFCVVMSVDKNICLYILYMDRYIGINKTVCLL